MKRDWDLIRRITLDVESMNHDTILNSHNEERDYIEHMRLLVEAGYCDGEVIVLTNGVPMVTITRLTMDGHDFADAIRNETTWGRVKTKAAQVGGDVTLSVVKALAEAAIKAQLGL